MREKLATLDGARTEWSGTFSRFGSKTAFKGPPLKTVLLVDIRDAVGQPATDHLWFNLTKEFAALDLQPGDRVKFNARVADYWKGYEGDGGCKTRDFKLSRPTNIRKLTAPAGLEDLPLFSQNNV
jgi:hypothetical protein